METNNLSIGITFMAGLLSFLSPCVLPLIPAYIGYMGGRVTHSVAMQTSGAKNGLEGATVVQRANLLLHGLAFVGGFTFVFVLIGLMTTAFIQVLGNFATTSQDIIARVGGILIIFFGLHFMGVLRRVFAYFRSNPNVLGNVLTSLVFGIIGTAFIVWGFIEPMFILPVLAGFWLWLVLGNAFTSPLSFWSGLLNRIDNMLYTDTRPDMQPNRGSGLGSSFVMGIIFSAGWTPCIGPIYGAVLGVAANQGDIASATPLLIAYSLGLGIPFLLSALLIDSLQGILGKLKRHMHTLELVSGGLLVVIGFMVASGQLTRLSQALNNDFSDFSFRVEECGVGFFQGHLGVQHIGACMAGQLVPVSLNQGTNGQISADNSRMEYVFTVTEALNVDVEVWNIEPAFIPMTTLYDQNGKAIATSTSLTPQTTDRANAFTNVQLPSAGLYTLVFTNPSGETVKFRARIISTKTTADTSSSEVVQLDSVPAGDVLRDIANIGSISAIGSAVDPIEGIAKGNLAPEFSITTVTGEEVTLSSLKGKVVLLNFWGTWCAPCIREMPELQALYQQYGDVGFTVLGVAVRDTEDSVKTFSATNGITFPLALDEGDIINRLFAIPGQPSTLLIGADGVIIAQFFSIVTKDQLLPLIESALANAS